MAEFVLNPELTKTVLMKRNKSMQLTKEEARYSHDLLDYMMTSKASFNQVVKAVTGDELRATTQVEQDAKLRAEAKDAAPNSAVSPVVAPTMQTYPGLEPVVRTTDINDRGDAAVSTDTSVETGVNKADDSMSEDDKADRDAFAEGLKSVAGVDEPFALATWMVQQGYKPKSTAKAAPTVDIKKDGDIVPEANNHDVYADEVTTPAYPQETTPFQHLLGTLQQMVSMASYMKQCAADTTDPDVSALYDGIVDKMRDICESLLAGLTEELQEAQDGTEEVV